MSPEAFTGAGTTPSAPKLSQRSMASAPSTLSSVHHRHLGSHGLESGCDGSAVPGDLGADITGIDPVGRKTVVQAKRYFPGATIGSPVIQALIGSQTIYEADRSVLITTGSFTRLARELAAAMDVELVDGPALVGMSATQCNDGFMTHRAHRSNGRPVWVGNVAGRGRPDPTHALIAIDPLVPDVTEAAAGAPT